MPRTLFRDVVCGTAGTCFYVLLGYSSLQLGVNHANASVVWPLVGLAIGALARFGYRFWPVVFFGSLINNLLVNVQHSVPLHAAILAALGIAVAKSGEALIGAWLCRRALGFPPQLSSTRGVTRFILSAVFIPPVISASLGLLSLWLAGILPASEIARAAAPWLVGNATGILTCAPLFFINSLRPSTWKWSRPAVIEGLIVFVLLILAADTISGIHLPETLQDWPKSYMIIPLVLWIAFRFGRRGAVIAALLLLGFGVFGTMWGFAAFPSKSYEQSLRSLQVFIGVVAIIGLTVSVLNYQLRQQQMLVAIAMADQTVRLATITRENAMLTASAVHDLQSPLSGIRNLLQLVRAKPGVMAGPQGDGLLADMQAAVEQMFSLVTDALSTSGPASSDPFQTGLKPCDIPVLLCRALDEEQAHADSKNIRIELQVPAHSVVIPTLGVVVQHIVGNFLSNAVKFSSPGTTVFLALEESKDAVKISVTDEGPGISKQDRLEIFSGQKQAHIATPTAGESSSGLGLYLTNQLAERLGAVLSCDATPRGGSIFSVTLKRT